MHSIRSGLAVATMLVAVACVDATDARARRTARGNAEQVHEVVEQYLRIKRACPRDVGDLRAAGIATRSYVDPWGAELLIVCEAGSPHSIEVRSMGPDGVANNEDDITSTVP